MKCENCGAEVTEGRFCNYCGSELPREGTTNIKGNNNTVNTINNYYSAPEARNEYIEPELIEFIPKDDSFLQREAYIYIIIVALLFLVYMIFSILIGRLVLGYSIIVIAPAIYFYKNHKEHKQAFYDSEYEREERIHRINYKREYDAWFDSLSEAEKQTELMRRIVEKNR